MGGMHRHAASLPGFPQCSHINHDISHDLLNWGSVTVFELADILRHIEDSLLTFVHTSFAVPILNFDRVYLLAALQPFF